MFRPSAPPGNNATTPETPAVEIQLPSYINTLVIIALVNAVLCNVFILIRFLEFHVYVATVLGIITATIQDFLSVGAIVPFCKRFRPSAGYVFGEGFWSMIASMIFSFAATIFLSVDFHMTPNFRAKGSGVTHKQRILIVEAMGFCFYLAIGSLCLFYIEPDWTFLEAMFFSMATITTIGFGDGIVKSTGGRLFVIAYASGGIVLFAVCINGIRYVIMEDLHQRFALRAKNRKAKRDAAKQDRDIQRRLRETRGSSNQGQAGTEQEEQEQATMPTAIIYRRLASWTMRRPPPPSMGDPIMQSKTEVPNSLDNPESSHTSTSASLDKHPQSSHSMPTTFTSPHCAHTVDGTETTSHDITTTPEPRIMPSPRPSPALPPIDTTMRISVYPKPVMIQSPTQTDVPMPDESDSNQSIRGSDPSGTDMPSDDDMDHNNNNSIPNEASDIGHGQGHDSGNDTGASDDQRKRKHIFSRLNPFHRRQSSLASPRSEVRRGTIPPPTSQDQERELAYRETMSEYRRRVEVWVAIFLFFWVIGATIYTFIEDWDYMTSFYFVFVAFSTIGYGDVVPQTVAGRSFFLVYCIVGVVTVTSLASVISEALSKKMRRHVIEVQLKKHRRHIRFHGRLHGETHSSHQRHTSDDDADHGQPDGPALPSVEHQGDLIPKEERQYDVDIKKMVKVSRDFHDLLQRVLVSSKNEQIVTYDSLNSVSQLASRHESQSQREPDHCLSRPDSFKNSRSSSTSAWRDVESGTVKSLYEFLSDPDDNPSITRDLDQVRVEALYSRKRKAKEQQRLEGKFFGGQDNRSFTPSPDQIQMVTWPTHSTSTPPPDSTPELLSGQPNSKILNDSVLQQTSRPAIRSSDTNMTSSTISPTSPNRHPTKVYPPPQQRNYSWSSNRRQLELQTAFPASDSLALATETPTDKPLKSSEEFSSSTRTQHVISMDSQIFNDLCVYADECRRMVESVEDMLTRMAAWERRERKLERKRQQVCTQQQALLHARKERLASLSVQRGDVGDVIEDEQELIELLEKAIELLTENPIDRNLIQLYSPLNAS
ncbi:hypothetical protein BGW42_008424 [Actinomortierella wolfii]|nr:hypothetical protein BGW42_008424 [Actinomortierella wolfii]